MDSSSSKSDLAAGSGASFPPPPTPPKKKFSQEDLADLFNWVDGIPFKSKCRNNIHRDFSDAVLMAELIHHHFPRLVSLHSFSRMCGMRGKLDNWERLNDKVLVKIGIRSLCASDVFDLANAKMGAIEQLLDQVREKLALYQIKMDSSNPPPGNHSSDGGSTFTPSQLFRGEIYDIYDGGDRDIASTSTGTGNYHTPGSTRRQQQHRGRAGSNTGRGGGYNWPGRIESDWAIPIPSAATVSSTSTLGSDRTGVNGLEDASSSRSGVYEDTCTVHAAYDNVKYNGQVRRTIKCIVYNGHRLIPEDIAVHLQSKLDTAHEANQGFHTKVRRLETLVALKEDRLEDLTLELHDLKLQVEQYRRCNSRN